MVQELQTIYENFKQIFMKHKDFLNTDVIVYLSIIVGVLFLISLIKRMIRSHIQYQRKKANLPKKVIINVSDKLENNRFFVSFQMGILFFTIVLVPFIMMGYHPKNSKGLLIALFSILIWLLIHGTDIFKNFLAGFAFKILTVLKSSIQIGDRATIKGVTGKILQIDSFYITLQTIDEDQVNIPTFSLWSENIISINGGASESLTVLHFYIDPCVSQEQCQTAEDIIWDAMQASVYIDFTRPMQIYLSQTPCAIQLTAKAYVASTYNELSFKSDITRAFLSLALVNKIPLSRHPIQDHQE
ncbi:MAG: mechanosensitive ion channel [Candidatus Magnetomorum sp.]|nr:mechanosensitive ion channel [Candidatus Magnetomorum sp.]